MLEKNKNYLIDRSTSPAEYLQYTFYKQCKLPVHNYHDSRS